MLSCAPENQNGQIIAAALIKRLGQRGSCLAEIPFCSVTAARMSSSSKSLPPRIGFSIKGLV